MRRNGKKVIVERVFIILFFPFIFMYKAFKVQIKKKKKRRFAHCFPKEMSPNGAKVEISVRVQNLIRRSG